MGAAAKTLTLRLDETQAENLHRIQNILRENTGTKALTRLMTEHMELMQKHHDLTERNKLVENQYGELCELLAERDSIESRIRHLSRHEDLF